MTTIDKRDLDQITGGFVSGRFLVNHPRIAAGFLAAHPCREERFLQNHPIAGARVLGIQHRWGLA
jgi:hypothetical protein